MGRVIGAWPEGTRPPEGISATYLAALRLAPVMELRGIVLDAFQIHLEEHLRAELAEKHERLEAERWRPIRDQLRATRSSPTWEEQARRRQHRPAWQLAATRGWPPIRIPGTTEYLTYQHQENAA